MTSMSAGPRLLVAEDDEAMRDLIVTQLRHDGYEVIEASDGAQLLDHIGAVTAEDGGGPTAIAMIISDLRMPGLSGLDLLAALRCAEWQTPVVLITAFASEETHAEARDLGALCVLDKPFPLERLRAIVRTTLAAPRSA